MKRTNNYNRRLVLLLLLTTGGLTSCKDYLGEPPSRTTSLVVTTTAQLDALLNNYNTFYSEGNRTAIHSTDDYELTKALYDARPGAATLATVEFMLWDTQFLPDDTREGFWSGEFRKIF